MAKNPVVFWELASHDAEKTAVFLKKVFGWVPRLDKKTGIYDFSSMEAQGDFSGGGVFTLRRAKLPFLTIYIRVENIQAKARLITKCGGFIIERPHEISPGTEICLFNEPSGVTLAMLERTKKKR